MLIAIHQPHYLPWLGYLDKIDRADVFIALDTVQYKKNEFQNRNRIKTATGWQWLTVPVLYRFPQTIREVEVNRREAWGRRHLQALLTNYAKAPFFKAHLPALREIYAQDWGRLLDINLRTVRYLMDALGITTPVVLASDFDGVSEEPTERLIDLCRRVGGTAYLAGAGSRDYMDFDRFTQAGVEVIVQDFRHPIYPQLFGPFEPYMSAVDLLFNCGDESIAIIRQQNVRKG